MYKLNISFGSFELQNIQGSYAVTWMRIGDKSGEKYTATQFQLTVCTEQRFL